MKTLDINFAGGRFRYLRRRTGERFLLAFVLTAGGAACSLMLAATAYSQMRERTSLAALEEKLSQRLAAKQPEQVKPITGLSPAKVEALNSAIGKLNIPWRDLFDSVEQATPGSIALISLEPDGEKKSVVLIAEASSPESMLDYLGRLEDHALFSSVLLVKHEINKQDPNSPYRFQFEARWKDPTP